MSYSALPQLREAFLDLLFDFEWDGAGLSLKLLCEFDEFAIAAI